MVENVGYTVTLRGVVNVKGKGQLTTYFVDTDQCIRRLGSDFQGSNITQT